MSESNKFDVLCSYPYLRRMNIQEAHDVTTLLTSNKNEIFHRKLKSSYLEFISVKCNKIRKKWPQRAKLANTKFVLFG